MFKKSVVFTLVLFICEMLSFPAAAQFMNERTVIVDPKDTAPADFQTIQEAIDAIVNLPPDPGVQYTVFIHAGEYPENVLLNQDAENIDLIGIDRGAVIIKPALTGSGIKITSGTETARNNRIANLTIETTNGHGIEIVQGTAVPKNINIEGVTIRTDGLDKHGIEGSAAEDVRIFDCDIDAGDSMGIHVGSRFQIISSSVQNQQESRQNIGVIHIGDEKSQITVENCFVRGGRAGLYSFGANKNTNDVQVVSSEIAGTMRGVYLETGGSDWLFRNCLIRGENVNRDGDPIDVDPMKAVVHGVNLKTTRSAEVVFQSCRIAGIGHRVPDDEENDGISPEVVSGIRNLNLPNCRVIECNISAVAFIDDETTVVYGINCEALLDDDRMFVEGGTVTSAQFDPDDGSPFNKAVNVFDLKDDPLCDADIFVSGTTFTKWHGPIGAAGTPGNLTQSRVNVQPADDDAILTATDLTAAEQPEVEPTGQPDGPRVLVVVGNTAGMGQDVYLEGTNEGNDRIVEKIKLNGTTPVKGKLAFATVTNIILPARTGPGPQETVKIGTTNTLGLPYPLSANADVLEFARKGATANSYTIEAFSLTAVDEIYSTFAIPSITANDSFRWVIRAPR